jgi:NTE family protein
MAGDPPDITASPQLAEVGLFEFHRAAEAIAAGHEAIVRALPQIREIVDLAERNQMSRQRLA